jgi:hypothetical protein
MNSTNGAGCDLLNITGALNVQAAGGNPFVIRLATRGTNNAPGPLANFNKFTNYTWTVATASGGIAGFAAAKFIVDASAFANDFSGGGFAVAAGGNSLQLKYLAAPQVVPRVTSVVRAGGGALQLGASGGAGQSYILSGSTSLAPANWIPLRTNQADVSGLLQFTDPQATNYPQRFYRLSSP